MDYDQLPDTSLISIEQVPTDKASGGISRFLMWFTEGNLWKKFFWLITVGCIIIFIYIFITLLPPRNFIPGSMQVTTGSSVRSVGNVLREQNIIKNTTLFSVCSRLVTKRGTIATGNYLFESPEHVCRIAYRMSRGMYGNTQIKITIPEGSTYLEIADIIKSKYPDFNTEEFLKIAKPKEGTLFPDTYFFFSGTSSQNIVDELLQTHNRKTSDLFTGISPEKQKDIIIMASILEREANNAEEAKVISGILWKRIAIGMPLQADATLRYTTGRGSDELTLDDLRTDGPYNTYTRTGLPPGPIGNPGIAMMQAAMNPEKSAFLYYLHDNNGKVYYASNHDQHVRNKQKYLK
jgi:UPF0755 protein